MRHAGTAGSRAPRHLALWEPLLAGDTELRHAARGSVCSAESPPVAIESATMNLAASSSRCSQAIRPIQVTAARRLLRRCRLEALRRAVTGSLLPFLVACVVGASPAAAQERAVSRPQISPGARVAIRNALAARLPDAKQPKREVDWLLDPARARNAVQGTAPANHHHRQAAVLLIGFGSYAIYAATVPRWLKGQSGHGNEAQKPVLALGIGMVAAGTIILIRF